MFSVLFYENNFQCNSGWLLGTTNWLNLFTFLFLECLLFVIQLLNRLKWNEKSAQVGEFIEKGRKSMEKPFYWHGNVLNWVELSRVDPSWTELNQNRMVSVSFIISIEIEYLYYKTAFYGFWNENWCNLITIYTKLLRIYNI